jgi:protein O-GlcNAc transferase
VGRNLAPLFAQHDRGAFEVFCYAQVARPDEMTEWFRQRADGWREIGGLSDEQVAAQISQDRIDILVDLTMHMGDNRLLVFARKPAPVQVTCFAYPGSTGVETIDYRLTDPYLDEPEIAGEIYSEKSARLANSFWCFDAGVGSSGESIDVGPLPALQNGYVTFGCLNNFCKINDRTLEMWAGVMGAVRDARLLVLAPVGWARTELVRKLQQLGIAAARVEVSSALPRNKYLELYHRIDIGLDTIPYNGHTTSLDSFWMGVPVITMVGSTVVGRAGWSQLSNLGLTELAARTPGEFTQIASALAADIPRLSELRAGLRERMKGSPLMDAPGFARSIESAYRGMWRKWCEGLNS